MGRILNEFKNKVPCTSKVKKLSGFANKNNQIKLFIELRKEFLEMTEYNHASKKTINNLFYYIDCNILSDDYNYLKNIVNILVQTYSDLENKINNDNLTEELKTCYKHILNHIKLFEEILAKRLNKEDKNELEHIIMFEKISYIILEKRDLKKSIKCINSNVEILNYYNYEGKDLNQLLFEKYTHAKISNDIKSLDYYTSIIKHIMFLYKINFDRRKFSDILNESKNIRKSTTRLDKKIQSLDYNPNDERFILNNEQVISIDANGAKILDDALSVEKLENGSFILGIHIADVCSLISDKNQILDRKNLPAYILKTASLNKGEYKNAITLFIEINKYGAISDYRILKSNIIVRENLSHLDVKKIINKGSIDEISKFILELEELYMIVENSKLESNPSPYKIGSLIVQKFMMLFGCIISKYFEENNFPYIYLTSREGKSNYSLSEKAYETGFEIHGLGSYGRITSPIIDDVSRVNQVLLYKYMFENDSDKTSYALEKKLHHFVHRINNKKLGRK